LLRVAVNYDNAKGFIATHFKKCVRIISPTEAEAVAMTQILVELEGIKRKMEAGHGNSAEQMNHEELVAYGQSSRDKAREDKESKGNNILQMGTFEDSEASDEFEDAESDYSSEHSDQLTSQPKRQRCILHRALNQLLVLINLQVTKNEKRSKDVVVMTNYRKEHQLHSMTNLVNPNTVALQKTFMIFNSKVVE